MLEIPDFLSEDECKFIIRLAKLKGLEKSQTLFSENQDEAMEMLSVDQMDIFNLLDRNQDGQLQLKEVLRRKWLDNPVEMHCENIQHLMRWEYKNFYTHCA